MVLPGDAPSLSLKTHPRGNLPSVSLSFSVSLRSFVSTRVSSFSSLSFYFLSFGFCKEIKRLSFFSLSLSFFLHLEKGEKDVSDGFNLVVQVRSHVSLNLFGFQGSWMTRAVEDLMIVLPFVPARGRVHKKIVVIGQRVTLFISSTKVSLDFP